MEAPQTPLEQERARLKALYKEDLQKRKAFLEELEQKRKLSRVEQALGRMLTLSDDIDQWTAQLQAATIEHEARVEQALSTAAAPSAPVPLPPQMPVLPTDLRPGPKSLDLPEGLPMPPPAVAPPAAAPRKSLDLPEAPDSAL